MLVKCNDNYFFPEIKTDKLYRALIIQNNFIILLDGGFSKPYNTLYFTDKYGKDLPESFIDELVITPKNTFEDDEVLCIDTAGHKELTQYDTYVVNEIYFPNSIVKERFTRYKKFKHMWGFISLKDFFLYSHYPKLKTNLFLRGGLQTLRKIKIQKFL